MLFCEKCGEKQESETRTEARQETLTIRGEPISQVNDVRVCLECGSDIWDNVYDDWTINKAYLSYNKKFGKERGYITFGEVYQQWALPEGRDNDA